MLTKKEKEKSNKKRICHRLDFAVPVANRGNIKKSKTMDFYLDLAEEQRKLWNVRVTVIAIVVGALRTVSEKNGDYPDYSIVKIGQNIEMSPGDLRRLAVTQTLVKDH